MFSEKEIPDFLIRNFQPEDFEKITELWTSTGLGNPKRADSKEIINDTIANGGKLLIMETTTGKEIIGTSWMTNDKRRVHMHHLCIKNKYRGKGLGAKLIESSMEYVRTTGLQVKVEVEENNKYAIKLYKRFGFKYLGDYNVYINRETALNK
jgi:ribosomal protein S18 acetylase RimI-like enzyme